MISQKLLDSDFRFESENITEENGEYEIKYFYKFIPANFTQSELDEFVKELGKITKSSNPNTVVDDFIKIGAVTSTFLNHGENPKQTRPKRGCYWNWYGRLRCYYLRSYWTRSWYGFWYRVTYRVYYF